MMFHVIRLNPNEDLEKALSDFVRKNAIQAGCILTGIGSLSKLRMRFANQNDYQVFEESFEIISLQGTLGQTGCHIHGSFANSKGEVIGGHIREGNLIRTTAEIVIVEIPDWKFTRKSDEKTGYLELNAEKKK